MAIVLHPHAAEPTRLRVWVGVFGRARKPQLAWRVDGTPAAPHPLRDLEPARDAMWLNKDEITAFTGVFEFQGLAPGTPHVVDCASPEESARQCEVWTLPDRVPEGFSYELGFNVLLVSCYHQHEDGGAAGPIVEALSNIRKIDLTLLLGDQVYLDLPTLKNFKNDTSWLARQFEKDYALNWLTDPSFPKLLDVAPSVSCPDDHEFWNNYPHWSTQNQNTWTDAGRKKWKAAALALYRAFQLPGGLDAGEPFILDVPPLSFFIADARSLREENRAYAMPPDARTKLRKWVERLDNEARFGIFVTGQSLWSGPASTWEGKVADYELANYGDYAEVVRTLADARNDILCITGDVHWGRVVEARDWSTSKRLFEVITSPSSLVTNILTDTRKDVVGFLKGIFGNKDPWPRHSRPPDPQGRLAKEALEPRHFGNSVLSRCHGNQAAILSFLRSGNRVRCRAEHWWLKAGEYEPRDKAFFELAPH